MGQQYVIYVYFVAALCAPIKSKKLILLIVSNCDDYNENSRTWQNIQLFSDN